MRDHPNALMIFAAGLGTRMRPLTDHQPKPLIPVAGRPLIDHALAVATEAGVERIVANTHYLADQLERHLDSAEVALSHEPEVVLETGGGLRKALPLLGPEPVFTMNSDAVWTGANPLRELAAAWDPERMDGLLLLLPRPHATGYSGEGDFMIDAEGRLSRGPGAVYSGAQIIKTSGLHDIREDVFSLNVLWNKMIDTGRLFGTLHTGGWCDVGRPDGIAQAEALLAGDHV